jgi:hypothetical protein
MPIYTFKQKDTGNIHQVIAPNPNAGRRLLAQQHECKITDLEREYKNPAGVVFKQGRNGKRNTTRKSTFRKPGV